MIRFNPFNNDKLTIKILLKILTTFKYYYSE